MGLRQHILDIFGGKKVEIIDDNEAIKVVQVLLHDKIDFTLSHISTDTEQRDCLMAVYYSKKLGKNIIIDEEFPKNFVKVEDFINRLISTQKETMLIKEQLK